ncbi:hypothetical protein KR100_08725 [Synechococcus sp. KORDI-100]|uniref:cobaltochelatase subunit CobN n=1 Tax=Synechococcus sp. KORDI-100 TaxID=1280380 RepID=UPI0004E0465E|nr:cobaltochelatase subunit CobN [Synechococcus sp. KORDI-100]AII43443.1 hypothetical protein KR100_08725 [Synechococcus sp. KORDI-100]
MHRLASCPGLDPPEDVVLVEQPPADVLLLSSAGTDLSTLASCLEESDLACWRERIRALDLSQLQHPAQVDHYLRSTADNARVVVLRLLGGRGHWSYGLEQLQLWQQSVQGRQLVVLSGTQDQQAVLHPLGSIATGLADRLATLLREGGSRNMGELLKVLDRVLSGLEPKPDSVTILPLPDPLPWEWGTESGARVGVVLYRSLLQADDLDLARQLNRTLREAGLCPRLLWVSSLRDAAVQAGVVDLLSSEGVELVITGTAFASVRSEDAGLGSPIWDQLDCPVLQLLTGSRPREAWNASSRGLDPLDLSLQVVMPELDGRVTTRPCGFRQLTMDQGGLATALPSLIPDAIGIQWLVEHTVRWIELRRTPAQKRQVALVLANYPVRDGRLANGVGLDTPSSCVSILRWLAEAGYDLGDGPLPEDGDALMRLLLSGRTNAPESRVRPPLAHLPHDIYLAWWNQLPADASQPIARRWGHPLSACDQEPAGFPIHGLRFGRIVVLIQPDRGYDPDQIADLHSPDLPPPHRYLAQYLWLKQIHRSQLMVHVGKHGSAEWLPGKAVGLSDRCGPHLALGAIPHLYPFIVNDPGEGSQAKRRGHAVILDHLTPPLGRAGLYGPLQTLENLLDELVEARELGSERVALLQRSILETLKAMDWPGISAPPGAGQPDADLERHLDAVETYLCELKESQIRIGLHRLGERPAASIERELLMAIARAPSSGQPGLTQAMAIELGLGFDPWQQEDGDLLSPSDQQRLAELGSPRAQRVGDGTAWLETQGLLLLETLTEGNAEVGTLHPLLARWLDQIPGDGVLSRVRDTLWPRLVQCAPSERDGFLRGASGQRIAAGPSGAPSRGRPDVLPTGRNFYSVDLRGLPTEAAWDLGRRSAERLLDLHLLEQGEPLRHLALSVWGTATMRNGGEDIAQLLALMGVRPVWDGPTRRMVDLEVIPASLLGRSRVDVVLRISGLFRDAFPHLVGWVDRAHQRIASLTEDDSINPLAALVRHEGPQSRIFGSAPGAYGAGLQALIDHGSWENRSDLGEAFLQWSRWRYDGSDVVVADRSGLEQALQRVQVVLHNQDNREHDLLDSDDYYQFHGGLSAAVETSSGQRPQLWFGDHSRHERPRLHRLEKELDKVVRSRLLNPRWINGMKQHGYKGAFEMGASLDYLFAYDAATDRVPDWCYGALCDQWLADDDTLSFLSQRNPWVLRDMAERLLEASNRGLWEQPRRDQLDRLRDLVISSEARIERGDLTC